ncbi:DNA glycosylase [Halarcobacter mediterraneus]|uniref:DNA glycosylase n=1 Tax=Halarcobacter mediterraneus TaxID=2023153 RepID=A0A4Q1AWL1_9BACT|nr:uracil-DNA glycosylase family protein [Halarcobacter mediterraneus]RXK12481.1 DNA glycosylase [Halarcobacter mediterraneus]
MFKHFHPYKPYLNKDTKKIIVGTLPPPRFCNKEFKKEDVNFCYGSKDNLLWQVLDKVFNLDLLFNNSKDAVVQRKNFLDNNQIGICDIVDSCERSKIDASDLGMENIVLRDMLYYLKEYKNIDTLIFTGGNSKNGPEFFLRKILKKQDIKFELIDNEIPKLHKFYFENREFKTISLTSPSNAANRYIGSNKLYKERKEENKKYTTFDFRMEQYSKVFKENI